MYYIYTHIDTHIDIQELSEMFNIDKFYMHKIFKTVFKKNIYESIKSIRLQKAASLLITNKHSTISEIANSCGYSSHASFIKAFKERFYTTPKEWRNGEYINYSNAILKASNIPTRPSSDFSQITPTIATMPDIKSYYIRNKGYIHNLKETWQRLHTLILTSKIKEYSTMALLHDNPTITDLNECQYIACLATKEKKELLSQKLPQFTVSSGVYAKFDYQGKGEDLIPFIHWIYHEWLIESHYETSTKPSYIVYHKNNFFNESNELDISYYLPIEF
jgi:AraC family transcriptional regulator